MRTGRPIPELILSAAERETLQNWSRRPKSAQALALRARMILRCAEGRTNTQVAEQVQVRIATVGKWRQRFVERRLDGLLDEPRPGAPRKVSDADVERALTMTLESTPKDATHWSTRSLAKEAGLSRSTVGPSPCSRIAARPSSFPRTRCLSTKCAILWACIWTLRIVRWFCASMKRARSKR